LHSLEFYGHFAVSLNNSFSDVVLSSIWQRVCCCFFLSFNSGCESAKVFFSVAFLVIYSVSYNMSFLEVPDVSCIWSVVTICSCVRFHNIFS